MRQQTGAARLLDCRAYELASAADTNGYDVTSTLVPGLEPLTPQPGAGDRVLYSLQFGTVPGAGDPTNFGQDPYVATRGCDGWNTSYVGIPASGTPSTVPFGSPLLGSSGGLSAFAFGNGTLCDPCFSDGSTGIPVHMAERQPRAGPERLDRQTRRRTGRATSASRCPMTAATSSSARRRNSRTPPPKAT